MSYDCIRRVLVVIHATIEPSDAEWADWMRCMQAGGYDSILVITEGAAPTSKQRTLTNEFWGTRTKPKMAVVTDSKVVRGAIFAFYWLFQGAMKPFAPANLDEAMAFLQVPPQDRPAVLKGIQRVRSALERRIAS